MKHEPIAPAAPEGAPSSTAPARAPRPRAEYRWTPAKAQAFVVELAHHGKVAAAARAVGMTRQSAYRLRARMPVVAEVWDLAQAAGRKRRPLDPARDRLAGAKATHRARQGDTSEAAR